jgi:hypothetical protein
MIVKDNEFNLFWSVVIICLCSAVVGLGIREINMRYRPVHRNISAESMRHLVMSLHGHVDVEALAVRRRQAHARARKYRNAESDNVIRFLRTLIP